MLAFLVKKSKKKLSGVSILFFENTRKNFKSRTRSRSRPIM